MLGVTVNWFAFHILKGILKRSVSVVYVVIKFFENALQ